ncbi:hypothetical protein AAIP31_002303 [Flavobacterium psychrophilum]|jgi:hypothetical protein
MEIFDYKKSLVENIYLISGPILAILGFAAILQLRLTKKAMIMSSKRQAAELATKQINVYCKQIIPLQDKFTDKKREQNIERIVPENLKKFTIQELESNVNHEIIKKKTKEFVDNIDDILAILNAFESFAIYFTKGVADEEIAFSSIGRTYCFSVETFSFDLSIIRKDDEICGFENVIKLYQMWNAKLKSDKISRELTKKQIELDKLKINKVDILGTK